MHNDSPIGIVRNEPSTSNQVAPREKNEDGKIPRLDWEAFGVMANLAVRGGQLHTFGACFRRLVRSEAISLNSNRRHWREKLNRIGMSVTFHDCHWLKE